MLNSQETCSCCSCSRLMLQGQLTSLDGQYQAKIMGEVERYQGLVKERDQLNTRWDEQNNLLVQSHERVIQDLTEEYDQKLQEEQVSPALHAA